MSNFQKLIKRITTKNENIGEYDIKILSANGNATAANKFEYTIPEQEAIVYKSENVQITVIDPIIKDEV